MKPEDYTLAKEMRTLADAAKPKPNFKLIEQEYSRIISIIKNAALKGKTIVSVDMNGDVQTVHYHVIEKLKRDGFRIDNIYIPGASHYIQW